MVAAFLQVHHDVEKRNLVSAAFGVQSLEVPRQDELVVFSVETFLFILLNFFNYT